MPFAPALATMEELEAAMNGASPYRSAGDAEMRHECEREVDEVAALAAADLLARVRDMGDPLHALLVAELACRYECTELDGRA